MKKAVIVSAARTPVGKIRGALAPLNADELGVFAVKAAIQRAGIQPEEVDEVVYGNCRNVDLKTPARVVALGAGLPVSCPGVVTERGCSSALNAICYAAAMVMAGVGDVYIAGGMESTSHQPFLMERGQTVPSAPPKFTSGRSCPIGMEDLPMGMTAERVAEQLGITRQECDEFGLLSQQRAAAAWEKGYFQSQIAPVTVPQRKGEPIVVTRDETVRETTLEGLASLKPSFKPDGVCTAGNSSPLTDGASAVVVMERELAVRQGKKILAEVRGFASAGCDPSTMGLGPVFATRKLLAKLDMALEDIDLIELNEAFASQSIGCIRQLGLDMDKVNVNGGAIALGHPFGATGGILTTKLLYEMERRNVRTGLVTFCIGGGQGFSALFVRDQQ